MRPCIDNLIVTLGIGDESHLVVGLDLINLVLAFLHDAFLLFRNDDIIKVEGKTCQVCHTITQILDTIQELTCASHTYDLDNIRNDAAQGLLRNDVIEIAHFIRDDAIDDDATYGRVDHAVFQLSINQILYNHFHRGM